MRFAFLMDPLESVNPLKDTTYLFMLGAAARGHQCYFLPSGGIHYRDGTVELDTLEVEPLDDPARPFEIGGACTLTGKDVDAVFIRTDPPFDSQYLMNTWLLELLPPRVFVMNRPQGVRSANEKIWANRFADLMPPTLITRSRERFGAYLQQHGRLIAKPTDGFGGMGVFKVDREDSNAQVIFEMLTHHGSREVIFQPFIPEAGEGDKRILLLDGEPLGAVLRLHGDTDHRNNFFAGGSAHATEITGRDLEIIERLKPGLKEAGLYFTGIDVIGDWLIEVNVTSPTCLREMNTLYDQQLEAQVIQFVEQQVESRRP